MIGNLMAFRLLGVVLVGLYVQLLFRERVLFIKVHSTTDSKTA